MDSRYHWILYAFIGAWGALLESSLLLVLKPDSWRQPTLGMALILLVAFTFAARALAEFCAAWLRPGINTDDSAVDVYVGPHRIATHARSTLRQWRAESACSPETARALVSHALITTWAMLGAFILLLVLITAALPEAPVQLIPKISPLLAVLVALTAAALAAYDWPRLLEERFRDELLRRHPGSPAGILALHAHEPESNAA